MSRLTATSYAAIFVFFVAAIFLLWQPLGIEKPRLPDTSTSTTTVKVAVLNDPTGKQACDIISSLVDKSKSGMTLGSHPVNDVFELHNDFTEPCVPEADKNYGSKQLFSGAIAAFLLDHRLGFLAVLASLFISGQTRKNAESSYENCALLSDLENVRFSWTLEQDAISVEVQGTVGDVGWLGIGFSSDGSMNSGGLGAGSDIIMGYSDSGAECSMGCVSDYHAPRMEMPVLDTNQDLEDVGYTFEQGRIHFHFKRPLNTGDSQDQAITATNQHIIWALSGTVPHSPTDWSRHKAKGSQLLDLTARSQCPGRPGDREVAIVLPKRRSEVDTDKVVADLAEQLGVPSWQLVFLAATSVDGDWCKEQNDPGCISYTLLSPRHSIPQGQSLFCTGFALPDGDFHTVRLEGLEDNTDVFHHLLIYLREDPALLGEIVPCNSNQNRGRIALQSSTPWLGHLPGGQPLDFPREAGYPVGTKLKYGILELHYDNPEGLQVSDVTGFRVFLTTTKRQHDVGHILIGINHGSLRMPHGIKSAHQSGSCYKAGPPEQEFHVFASMAHMHERGRSAWTEWHRQDQQTGEWKSMGWLAAEPAWDFYGQQFEPIEPALIVRGHDRFVHHCVWDTTTESQTVKGGSDEMCNRLTLYWPALNGEWQDVCIQNDTAWCDCSFGEDCLARPECQRPAGPCSTNNRDECLGDQTCVWCNSENMNACGLKNTAFEEACLDVGGSIGRAATIPPNPCSAYHASCGQCTDNEELGCKSCALMSTHDMYCLASTSQIAASDMCNRINGFTIPEPYCHNPPKPQKQAGHGGQ